MLFYSSFCIVWSVLTGNSVMDDDYTSCIYFYEGFFRLEMSKFLQMGMLMQFLT